MSMYMTNFNIVYYVQYCAFYVLGNTVLLSLVELCQTRTTGVVDVIYVNIVT
jgi:hypothetical protein